MSGSYSVIYSPKAKDDLREIYSYIAFTLLVPETAVGQVDRIRKAVRSLDFMPLRNPIVDWEPWKSMVLHAMRCKILSAMQLSTQMCSYPHCPQARMMPPLFKWSAK